LPRVPPASSSTASPSSLPARPRIARTNKPAHAYVAHPPHCR
jgi:hypothetical protein